MNKIPFLAAVHSIDGWLSEHEALFLYFAAYRSGQNGEIVEIGSWKGKSTVCLAQGLKDKHEKRKVWAIDPHKGVIQEGKKLESSTYNEFMHTIRSLRLADYVHPIVSTSEKAAKEWKKPISVLFIDGLHDYTNTKRDFILWNTHVISGGLIIFHDGFCGISGVREAIEDTLFLSHSLVDVGTVSSMVYGFIGNPNVFQKIRVKEKILLISLANKMNRLSWLPWIIKVIIIHKIIRLLLITRYTAQIYR